MTVSATAPVVETSVDFYESIYARADGDQAQVPWARGRPSGALVNWLNAVAPSVVRCGARVLVVGCGLGEDARELLRRGYDVTAFDCSRTAIEWARRSDPSSASCFHVADLFDPPARWRHRFDLVVEVCTLQALAPDRREAAIGAMSDLLSPHGSLLVISLGRDEGQMVEDGPPWPLSAEELLQVAALSGLTPAGDVDVFKGDDDDALRLRAHFRRC